MRASPAKPLIIIVATLVSLFSASVAMSADPAAFVGEWCNKDFNTRGNTRIRIYLDGEKLMVHMWGRCHPTECDWGETTATIVPEDKKSITVTWNQGLAVSNQQLTIQEDGSLKLSGNRNYKDITRQAMKEDGTFVKGINHDWSDPKDKSKK
jgi:hypothetical protein